MGEKPYGELFAPHVTRYTGLEYPPVADNLHPEIWDKLENTGRGAGGEIQLTDAIADLLADADVYAGSFSGTRYDCGSKLGYLQATVAYGLAHDGIGGEFRDFLKQAID